MYNVYQYQQQCGGAGPFWPGPARAFGIPPAPACLGSTKFRL